MRLRPAPTSTSSVGRGVGKRSLQTAPLSGTAFKSPSLLKRKRYLVACLTLSPLTYFIGSFLVLGRQVHLQDGSNLGITSQLLSSGLLVASSARSASKISEWLEAEASGPQGGNGAALKLVTAYLEPLWNVTIPGSVTKDSKSYIEPLPLRTHTPRDLQKVVYPRVQTCLDLPAKFPVDRGPQYGNNHDLILTNIGDQIPPPDYLEQQTPYCPVDADPYLPWIHDVFLQGSSVQFVAQNKRRCQTGALHAEQLERMEPQVALLQSVSVQRISNEQATQLAPELWTPSSSDSALSSSTEQRYRLVPYKDADADAKQTRFICKFHSYQSNGGGRLELGETLSEYPFSYELAAYRKSNNHGGLLTPEGKDNGKFWTSTLMFSCPLPKALQDTTTWTTPIRKIPIFHVDIVPIRTPARFPPNKELSSEGDNFGSDGGYYLSEEQIGPVLASQLQFDPTKAWGQRHVLPLPEASGRWENIPICPMAPDPIQQNINGVKDNEINAGEAKGNNDTKKKPYLLSACLWASKTFRTRGQNKHNVLSNTEERLMEWLEFHLMVGFDHVYVFDNSGAFRNATGNLKSVVELFPPNQVTWIDWPSQVCNNNIPAHDNTGERSSQYAAENSCRTRYGSYTDWIATFDTDEYLVPQESHSSLRSVVEQAQDTNILSFPSSRGKLRLAYSETANRGRSKLANTTYLQAFNCDGSPLPRPQWADRARKQLYRADYVLDHFVHYSTVTAGYMRTYLQAQQMGQQWSRYFSEDPPSERKVDELHEAMMVHTKSLDPPQLQNWKNKCRFDFTKKFLGCSVGFPWPKNTASETETYDPATGWQYNCFVNERVDDYWAPKLHKAMEARKHLADIKSSG